MNNYQRGLLATGTFILILGTVPAVTRLAVTTSLTVWDLWLLRCVVGGLIFAPLLIKRLMTNRIPRAMLLTGFVLAACQGWGAHLSSIGGMQFAPASHTSALGPGVISLWVAMWAFLLYRQRPTRSEAQSFPILVAGAILMLLNAGFVLSNPKMLLGDALYLLSSCTSAIYLVYLKKHRLDPLTGAALIAVFSGLVAGALFLALPLPTRLGQAAIGEVLLHVLVQGVIAGAFIYWLIGYAIERVGAQQFTIIGTLIPVMSIITGRHIAGDPYNVLDGLAILCIAVGILVGIRQSTPPTQSASPCSSSGSTPTP